MVYPFFLINIDVFLLIHSNSFFELAKLGEITLETEEQNNPAQLWNRISSVDNSQFALKNGDLYLTVVIDDPDMSSLKAEEADYSNDVVVEYLALNDDGKCCIPSQMWIRIDDPENSGYFTLANEENPMLLTDFKGDYQTETNTGLQIVNKISSEGNPSSCVDVWINDGFCDEMNNNEDCEYDGGDCCGADVNTKFCKVYNVEETVEKCSSGTSTAKECQCLDPSYGGAYDCCILKVFFARDK